MRIALLVRNYFDTEGKTFLAGHKVLLAGIQVVYTVYENTHVAYMRRCRSHIKSSKLAPCCAIN